MRIRTVLLWLVIAAFGLAAALGVVSILAWTIGPAEQRLIATASLVGLFGLTALLCVIVMDRLELITVMWIGVAASTLALLAWLFVLWIEVFVGATAFSFEDRLVKPAITLTIIAVWAAHLGLLVLPRADWMSSRAVRGATIVLTSLFGAGLAACVWAERFDEEEGRILGVLLVLAVFGTVASPTLALVETLRRRSQPEDIESKLTMEIVCPRCRTRQRLATGARRCVSCRLAIRMQVEEPKCRCGYLLYDLEGDACPECGRSLTAGDRWAGPPGASRPESDDPPTTDTGSP